MMTTSGKSGLALLIGSSPNYIGIGSGSGAINIGRTGLISETDRNQITSYDASQVRKNTILADWGSSEVSGLTLKEFAAFSLSSGGQCWNAETLLPNTHTFDGTEELQIQITFEVF